MKSNPLIPAQIRRRARLREICKNGGQKILAKTRNIRQLDFTSRAYLERQTLLILHETMENVNQHIQAGVLATITQTIAHYENIIERNTNLTIPMKIKNRVKSESTRLTFTTIFKGNVYARRIMNIERKIRINLLNRFDLAIAQQMDIRQLTNFLLECFFSLSSVQGGSVFGSAERLLVSEENRSYHTTAILLFKNVGVSLVKFHLTREPHENDIVDKIAQGVDFRLKNRLESYGIDPVGVYTLSELPDYPRPRAVYYLEPLLTVGFFPLFN